MRLHEPKRRGEWGRRIRPLVALLSLLGNVAMLFGVCEMEKQMTAAEYAAWKNENLKATAARRLAANAEYNRKNKLHYTGRKPECAPNRKAKRRLDARRADWAAMMGRGDFRGSEAAYHKPGSMQ